MEFRPILRGTAAAAEAEAINREAFPPEEYWSMDDMLRFSEEAGAELTGIYEEGRLAGFFLMLGGARCGYVYYFAIEKCLRNRGLGQQALRKLIARDPDYQIILDFEKPEPDAPNAEVRRRRKAFYLRSGFRETGRYTILNGYPFEVVCSGDALRTADFEALLPTLHAWREGFPAVLL